MLAAGVLYDVNGGSQERMLRENSQGARANETRETDKTSTGTQPRAQASASALDVGLVAVSYVSAVCRCLVALLMLRYVAAEVAVCIYYANWRMQSDFYAFMG